MTTAPGFRFQSRDLALNVFSGFTFAMVNIAHAISLAAFMFTGRLEAYLPQGIVLVLLANVISGLTIGLGSSLAGVIPTPKAGICVVVALMASAIAADLEGNASQMWPTVISAIMFSSLFTGLFLYLLGRLRIGNLIRFIPFPVVGGYFAGAGLLLISGALTTMAGRPLTMTDLTQILDPWSFFSMMSGIGFAVILYTAMRRYNHILTMPAILLAGIAVFYLVLSGLGISIAKARDLGLILPLFPAAPVFPELHSLFMLNADFAVLVRQVPSMLTIAFISAISLLLAVTTIEIGTQSSIDLETDLKSAGMANILNGLVGAVVSFHTDVDTIMAHRSGVRGRAVSIAFALCCAVPILLGSAVFEFCPKPIIGGLLFYFGLSILVEWVYDGRRKLPFGDYLMVIAILLSVAAFGFLQGVAFGIFMAAIVFVLNYSRINVVKHELSGLNCRSKVERAAAHQRLLVQNGDRIYILVLQGYLFFGTAQKLLDQVSRRLTAAKSKPVAFVIFDFRLVDNIDISAVKSFQKLKQRLQAGRVMLVFTHLNAKTRKILDAEDYFLPNGSVCRQFPDLDYGLEWCENQLIAVYGKEHHQHLRLQDHLAATFPEPALVSAFMRYLEPLSFVKGGMVFEQGQASDALYFIESGTITVFIDLGGGKTARLLVMREGTLLGEMGLYTRNPRSASAVAETPAVLFRLSFKAFQRMEKDAPQLCAAFHRFVVHSLSERIVRNNAEIRALIS